MLSQIEKFPEPFYWQEIRLAHCDDGQFRNSPACQTWMRQLASFVVKKLGISPRIRIRAYSSGRNTLLAVDAYASQTDKAYVAITVLLSGNHTYLSAPAGNQFDIELPGVIDALSLIESLLSLSRGILDYPCALWGID